MLTKRKAIPFMSIGKSLVPYLVRQEIFCGSVGLPEKVEVHKNTSCREAEKGLRVGIRI